jgi:hypothetical protein
MAAAGMDHGQQRLSYVMMDPVQLPVVVMRRQLLLLFHVH